jgi:cytidine deaminase
MARSELVVGLVGPLGADLHGAASLIELQLGRVGYAADPTISLSGLLDLVERDVALPTSEGPHDRYVEERQNAGGAFREATGRGDALALLAVAKIARRRSKHQERQGIEDPGEPPQAVGHVMRSMKHPDEVETLRKIYGERFVLVGILLPREKRIARLSERIANSQGGVQGQDGRVRALTLAAVDEEEDRLLGQQMRETFSLADVYVDMSDDGEPQRELERFFDALLGDPFVSPTRAEYAMFHAHAAGLRSVDLSRQVGAAIVGRSADVLSVGCNEVPAYGGGAYWTGDVPDGRDYAQGGDPNAKLRRVLMDQIRGALLSKGVLSDATAPSETDFRDALKDTRLDDLTEFGRVVHAEMHAMLDAARRGVSTQGSTLFSTTFPCHNCAKHIVAAGIEEVRYIAPYPKSLAEDLHPESIVVEPDGPTQRRVRFVPFTGIAPAMYGPLFTKSGKRRKSDGTPIAFDPRGSDPKLVREGDVDYLDRERLALTDFQAIVRKKKVALGPGALAAPDPLPAPAPPQQPESLVPAEKSEDD